MTMSRERVVQLDKAHVWHPYTAMDVYMREVDPFVIERAQGPYLFDMDGRRYIDANASWWLASLGHNHPRLVGALQRQATQMCHCSLAGTTHPQAAQLASELAAVAPPGLSRVFFSDDGSTAVEVAIKMAVQYFGQRKGGQNKRRFVSLEGAFHGETVGASSLGGVEVFRRPFASVLFDCVRVPSPADETCFGSAFEVLKEIMRTDHGELAAVVVEPLVQGAAGMQIHAPAYLQELRGLCDQHDVLLIADEVFTGYGRTGRMWACDHAGITPDILCVGKGFSGGMLPMAATLATERVFEGFFGGRSRALLYGHSYCGNPLGAAVAREVLAVMRDEDIIGQVQGKAQRIASAFASMAALPHVSRPRAIGMVAALDLTVAQPEAASRDFVESACDLSGQGYLGEAGWKVYDAARRRGAYLRPLGGTIYICPPLTIPDDCLDELLAIVRASIEEVVQSAAI
jgi:adenosylmethionine---8-amino-7-oxononanoate aminotransferase